MAFHKFDESDQQAVRNFNAEWLDRVKDPTQRVKTEARHDSQLSQFMREHFTYGDILNDRPIKPEECEPGDYDDNLYYRVHLPIQTGAFVGTFGSAGEEVRDVYSDRVYMSFMMLRTPTMKVNDYTLPAYPFSMLQQVQDSIGIDLHEARDWAYHRSLDETIQAGKSTLGNVFKGANTGSLTAGARGVLDPDDVSTLSEYHAERRSELDCVLMPEANFLQIQRFDATVVGDALASEKFKSGYSHPQIFGYEIKRTIKIDSDSADIMRTGNIYGFANPDGIGKSFTLHGAKTYIKKERQFTYIDGRIVFTFAWIVTKRIGKIELYKQGLDLAGSALADGTSDQVWQHPETVVERQYFNLEEDWRRPFVVKT